MTDPFPPPRSSLSEFPEQTGSPALAVTVGVLVMWIGGVGATLVIPSLWGLMGIQDLAGLLIWTVLAATVIVALCAGYWTARLANRQEFRWVSLMLLVYFASGVLLGYALSRWLPLPPAPPAVWLFNSLLLVLPAYAAAGYRVFTKRDL